MNNKNRRIFRAVIGGLFLVGFFRFVVAGEYLLSVLMLAVSGLFFYKAKTGD